MIHKDFFTKPTEYLQIQSVTYLESQINLNIYNDFQIIVMFLAQKYRRINFKVLKHVVS